jgi:hypothetical protein
VRALRLRRHTAQQTVRDNSSYDAFLTHRLGDGWNQRYATDGPFRKSTEEENLVERFRRARQWLEERVTTKLPRLL